MFDWKSAPLNRFMFQYVKPCFIASI